jgi:lipid A 4'-phosphatase
MRSGHRLSTVDASNPGVAPAGGRLVEMLYLKLRCSRIILGSFVLFALVVTAFPEIDLQISRLFFDGKSFPRDPWWQRLEQTALAWFLWFSVASVIAIYVCNRLLKQRWLRVDGRRVLFVLLVLLLGAGLIVNLGLKNHFGRARPRDVAEFGGKMQFTPAFVISHECSTNCSFSSGDAAGGFFSLALAMALSRRRRMFVAGAALGIAISASRIASGAHFFSDTVMSFFVMLIVADVLYYYVVQTDAERIRDRSEGYALKPAYRGVNASSSL